MIPGTDATAQPLQRSRGRVVRLVIAGVALLIAAWGALAPLRQAQRERAEGRTLANMKCPQGMRPIPGGSFMFGDRIELALDPFCLDATEVTVAAYRDCVSAGSCKAPLAAGARCNWTRDDRSLHPVNCLSWEDAAQFCAWSGKSLPSGAQWEYAARGGHRALEYPWGDEPPSLQNACWSPQDERDGTCAVAAFPPTTFGLHDMAGNVSEWVDDRAASADAQPRKPDSKSRPAHCSRGGSWMVGDPMLLHPVICAEREPNESGENLGVRCAASPVASAARH